MPSELENERDLLSADGLWAASSTVSLNMLWFEFLRASPSYCLARTVRMGDAAASDRERRPTDFEQVLSVYDDLGDVYFVKFADWWLQKGIRFFGFRGEKPRLGPIDVLVQENPAPLETLQSRAQSYIDGRWRQQGQPTCAILAVPLGLSRAQIVAQLDHLLSMYDDTLKRPAAVSPKYKMFNRKRDTNSLVRYLRCLTIKAYFPALRLYEVGALAGLSSTYSSRFDKEASAEDRDALKILTSRALHRGMMIAENAARGIFPSYQRHEHAIAPNWEELGRLLESQQDWEDGHAISRP